MRSALIPQKEYLKVAQFFHWATKEHFILWLTGMEKRHRRTEVILPRLAKRQSLFATRYGKRLVYSCSRKVRNKSHILRIEHGLGCTEVLVRFYRSNMSAIVIEERHFKKMGSRPEFGLWYPSGPMILVEFSTEHDFHYSNRMDGKLLAYKKNLWRIEERFKASGLIVFVLDVPREKVQQFVLERMPIGLPIFFTDYETFKSVPIGEQLSAPIYIWGEDGKTYPLTKDVKS